jgi:hypothetical protein
MEVEKPRVITLEVYKDRILARWGDKDVEVELMDLEEDPSESGSDRIDRINFEILVEYGQWVQPNDGVTVIGR